MGVGASGVGGGRPAEWGARDRSGGEVDARAGEPIYLKGTQGRVPHGSQFPWWSRSLVAARNAQRVAKSHSQD